MVARAELRVDGEVHLIEVAELEEAVRRAHVLGDAEVHHPPWTGELWRRVDEIDALRDDLDTPDARLAAHLLRPRRAGATAAVVGLLLVAAAAQFAGREAFAADPGLLHRLSLGWESTLLDGGWWTPWSATLLHESFFHLLGNLVIIAYCAWRTERALGASGLVGVVAGAILGAALAVVAVSPLGCIGASVLAFGLWGAQFAVGWRYGAAIPAKLRGHYGAGTVLVAAPLLVWSFVNPHVSFAGHLGGFVGGAVTVFLLPVATAVPLADRGPARRRALALAAAMSAVVPGLSMGAPLVPGVLAFPTETVLDAETRIAVDVPWRWAAHADAGLDLVVGTPDAPLHLARAGAETHATAPRTAAWAHDGQEVLAEWPAAVAPARAAVYAGVVQSARWEPPAELARVRRRWEESPSDPERTLAYAAALDAAGADGDAVAHYGELEAFGADWALRGARARVRVCAFRAALPGCDPDWRDAWLDRVGPADRELFLFGAHWASTDRPCAHVWRRHEAMVEHGGYSPIELRFALGECGD